MPLFAGSNDIGRRVSMEGVKFNSRQQGMEAIKSNRLTPSSCNALLGSEVHQFSFQAFNSNP